MFGVNRQQRQQSVFPKPAETTKTFQVPFESKHQQPQQFDFENFQSNIKKEFAELVNDKFGKIDEILMAIKEKQEQQSISAAIPDKKIAEPSPASIPDASIPTASSVPQKKKGRTKKTYYPITESMWNQVKSNFPDLPDDFKSKTTSDGEQCYIDVKGKKIPVDGKGVLKILNMKKGT